MTPPTKSSTAEYKNLLDWLNKSLKRQDLKKMIFLACIPAGEGECFDKPFKLFSYLENNDRLSETKTAELIYLLENIGRKDLVKQVQTFQSSTASNKQVARSKVEDSASLSMKPMPSEERNVDPPSYSACMELNVTGAQKIAEEQSFNQGSIYKSPTPSESMDYEEVNARTLVPEYSGFSPAPSNSDRNGMEFYRMERNPRGVCLIISNSDFTKSRSHSNEDSRHNIELEDRPGSKIDVENLQMTFKNLLFDVKKQEDVEGHEMYKLVSYFANDYDHRKCDCFVCIILSHGNEYGVYGVDGKNQNIQNLTRLFEETPSLQGKPKLFFFQACRGTAAATSFKKDDVESLPLGFSNLGIQQNISPSNSDFFFGYATPPGYAAWLSDTHGSWYISALCQAFREYGGRCSIDDIAIKCNSIVSKFDTQNREKQIPNPTHTLTKKLYFFPENII